MKKILIFCAAALAFAGCSKNEVTGGAFAPVNSDVIGFNTSTGSSRAADFTSAADLQSGFNVVGETTDGTDLFAVEDAGTVSSKFLYTGGKWGWEVETDDKKWPTVTTKYPLTFYAAFPFKRDTIKVGATTAAIYISPYGMESNRDLLAARSVVATKPVSGVVALNFKHILSKIAFQIVSPVDYKVYIQVVNIVNVANRGGIYDYKAGSYTTSPDANSAKDNFSHVNIINTLVGLGDASDKGVVVKSGNGVDLNDTWKLLPQSLTPTWNKATFTTAAKTWGGATDAEWKTFLTENPTLLAGAMIEVAYRMEDAAGKSIVGWKSGETMADGTTKATQDYLVKVAFPLNIIGQVNVGDKNGWLMAHSYTYQIKFGTSDATNGTVVDPNYKDNGGNDTNIPIDNPTTVKPGEDITPNDRYIGFDVLVDAWKDNSNEIK